MISAPRWLLLAPLLLLVEAGQAFVQANISPDIDRYRQATAFVQANNSTDIDRPLDIGGRTVAGLILAAAACALSMSAGVGGGGILVPIFNIVLGFGIKQSTALSQSVIAASGVGSCLYSLFASHPDDPIAPLVDLRLALVLTPALLLGVTVGVLLNATSPEWLVTSAIVVVLSTMAWRTLRLARRLRSTEKEARAAEPAPAPLESDRSCQSIELSLESSCSGGNLGDCANSARRAGPHPRRAAAARPAAQLLQLLSLWAFFAALQLGKSSQERCSWPYTGLYACQLALALGSTLLFTHAAMAAAEVEEGEHEEQLIAPQSDQLRQDAAWTRSHFGIAAGWAAAAGALAGLIGLGGGFLLNPLMLEFGIHPQVSAATSALMVLFASASATLSFAADGRLNIQYAAAFGLACGAAAFLGATALGKVVRRRGASVVVFLLAGIIAAGAGFTAAFDGRQALVDLMDLVDGWGGGFQSFCEPRNAAADLGFDQLKLL